MNLFLAVIFFCNGGNCYFWKSTELFYTEEKCIAALKLGSDELDSKGVPNNGTCLPINVGKNI